MVAGDPAMISASTRRFARLRLETTKDLGTDGVFHFVPALTTKKHEGSPAAPSRWWRTNQMTIRPRRRRLQTLTHIALALMSLLIITGCCGKLFRGSKDIVGLTISPSNESIKPQTTQQFTATGTYSDGTTGDVTPETTWISSDPAIAAISSEGAASGLSAGVTTISGDCQCYVVKTNLTISSSAAKLMSVAVTPADPTVNVRSTQQFTATGTYSNGTTRVITSSVTWNSSSNTIATVNSAGVATGVSTGSVTITATASGIDGATTLKLQ